MSFIYYVVYFWNCWAEVAIQRKCSGSPWEICCHSFFHCILKSLNGWFVGQPLPVRYKGWNFEAGRCNVALIRCCRKIFFLIRVGIIVMCYVSLCVWVAFGRFNFSTFIIVRLYAQRKCRNPTNKLIFNIKIPWKHDTLIQNRNRNSAVKFYYRNE